jgi:gamma-glutamyltranspeptidase/glutathione hydrolase
MKTKIYLFIVETLSLTLIIILSLGFVKITGNSSNAYSNKKILNNYSAVSEGHSAISTPRAEARDAAAEILAKGGNAVDAAVAALTTLAVVQTSSVGIAGYGGSIVIYSSKDKKVSAIDFDSRAPLALNPEKLNKENSLHGYLATGVPGIVAGLQLALKNHGTLGWNIVTQHAYELADKGIVVDVKLNHALQGFVKHADKASITAYLPNGVPEVGSIWQQKDLARVIKAIGDGGADAFYKGNIAKQIVKSIQANGGILTEEDFANFQAKEVEPIKITYRGNEIYAAPVPAAGITSLSILKTLEQFDIPSLKSFGTDYFTLFARTSQLVWEERFRLLGDPDFVKFSSDDLLSEKSAIERARKIREGKVLVTNHEGTDPLHTVNVVVIDKDQNIVSLTATQGDSYGSLVAVPGTGLVFGHGISRFDLTSGPNYPAPGKRPQHNMTPVVVLRDGKPLSGLGLPGGRYIVTVTAQLLVDILDFKLTPQQAVTSPRIHNEGDSIIKVTKDIPYNEVKELESKGFKVKQESELGGPANVIIIDQSTGKIDAASQAGPDGVLIK